MNKWIALLLAFAGSAPLLWYNFRDFFAEVDRERSEDRDTALYQDRPGYLEGRLDSWFDRIRFLWQVAFPLFVFWLIYTILSSVDW